MGGSGHRVLVDSDGWREEARHEIEFLLVGEAGDHDTPLCQVGQQLEVRAHGAQRGLGRDFHDVVEAVLAQATMCGKVCVKGGLNKASIAFSVNGNHGVVGVNNSAGAQNNQANVVAIAGTHP